MSPIRECWAVVPVKEAAHAKTRLAPALAHDARIALARAMLEDVLRGLADARGLAGIALVTVDPVAIELAGSFRAHVFTEGARDGHTGAVAHAARRLERQGCVTMLTVPGDVPGITPAEVEHFLAKHAGSPSFTICPAHDRRGSNAIAVSPPCAVPLTFGNDSFVPHLAAARSRGIEPTVVDDIPGIRRDVDTFEDALALRALGGARMTNALLTRMASRDAAWSGRT